jgi:hypothetical protein
VTALRHRRRRVPAKDPEIDRALEAMNAPELRAAVRAVLDELDEDIRASVVDTLIGRATKASSRWRPARPSQRMVEEAKSFADAARHIGHADPDDVTEHLRRATKAFLAGDHASARAVFEAILPPIASADINLGQHELVEEVLGVDARASVAQYVASVYTTTLLPARADAILRALEQIEGVGTLLSPIKAMEDVSAGLLPDLTAFLPLWVKRLQRFRPSKDEWETEHERWLREAVFRADGVGGLERIARETKRPQACLAWYEALADQGDWTAALKACDAAARMVRRSHWRCELLDGAALAAQELGRSDLSKRLEVAWRAAPTMTRLLRWIAVDGDEHERIRSKAVRSLARCPKTAARQIGLLRVLVGDVTGAAGAGEVARSRLVQSRPSRTHPVPVAGHTVVERDNRRRVCDGTRGDGPRPAGVLCGAGRGAQAKTEDTIHRGADPERALQHRPDRPGSRRRHRRDAHRCGEAN